MIKTTKDKKFEAIDGSEIQDLLTLAENLEFMSDDSYYYHVKEHQNDFAKWVSESLEEPELANQMQTAENREQVVIAILKHIIRAIKH